MTSDESKEIMQKLDTLEDAILALLRDIRNDRNKIILMKEQEEHHE